MKKSHRVKVLTKRMITLRGQRVKASDIAWELSFNGRLFGHDVYSSVVSKAEREALLRIRGEFFGFNPQFL